MRNKDQIEYLTRTTRATELLVIALEIHQAELAGEISQSDAIDLVIELNRKAACEIEKALAALHRTKLGSDPLDAPTLE